MSSPHPQAFFFGPKERPLFGWLHRPSTPASSVGLVICNPFGYETICAHRTLRHFAAAAVDIGIPTIRFDYDGTGDSAGEMNDDDRVGAWATSIANAVDALRERSGVTRVCLLGIRLGATLAVRTALDRGDIAGIIAIAPILKGKSYLREMHALSLAQNAPARPDDGIVEPAGYPLTAETQQAIKSLDISAPVQSPCQDILLLDRDDMPPNEAWAAALVAQGATVQRESLPGYVEMMLDAHDSVIPEKMIQAGTAWLKNLALPEQREIALTPAATTSAAEIPLANGINVEEQALFVEVSAAPATPLFGIVTRPLGKVLPDSERKAILLLNSGAVHHVGPSRLHVSLARRWAALGHTVMRLDLGGIGDSEARAGQQENTVYSPFAVEEVTAAVRFMKDRYQIQECITVGICSGAYHGFKTAVAATPLAAVIAINPLTFFWKEGMSLQYPSHRIAEDIMRYRTNAFRAESWQKLLSGKVDLWQLSQVLLRRAGELAAKQIRNAARILGVHLEEDLGTELQTVVRRGVDLRFIFSAGEPGIELLRTQGGSAVGRLQARGHLGIRVIDNADHTFTHREAREQLQEALTAQIKYFSTRLPKAPSA